MKIRLFLLLGALILIGSSIIYFERHKTALLTTDKTTALGSPGQQEKAKMYPPAVELVTPSGYINAPHITLSEEIGKKVVLIDFWTYSCINCQRTIPYLNAWYQKYKDQGLEIIGVHAPEFEFEKDYANVQDAVKRFGIQYPVVLDNNLNTWNAYQNHYWPHEYIIDIDGYIADDHIGEGNYDETEKKIQQLLTERAQRLHSTSSFSEDIVQPSDVISIDFAQTMSPETYFGSARNKYLSNGVKQTQGLQSLKIPSTIAANNLLLDGTWDFSNEYAENTTENARIVYKYTAKNVYIVAGSKNGATIRVFRDGVPITTQSFRGKDIIQGTDGVSRVHIQEERLYTLIQDTSYGEHTLEIIVEKQHLQAFTFTFG